MVLFDEFDKTFSNIKAGENEPDPQAGLLSLFDGVACISKIISCIQLKCNRAETVIIQINLA